MGATDSHGTPLEPGSLVRFEEAGEPVERRVVSVDEDEVAVQSLERHDLSIEETVPRERVVVVGYAPTPTQALLAAGWRLTPYGWFHPEAAPDGVELTQALALERLRSEPE